ncbi:MAG: hypothetical protein ACK47B_26340 [Armatimonadota bacterium]
MRFRRITRWLALLALFLYGAAPALACLNPVPTAGACRPEKAHTCACRADAHAGSDCCCGEERSGSDCRLESAPCGSPAAPVSAVPSVSYPLAALSPGGHPAAALLITRGSRVAATAPRQRASSPPLPPPRA